MCDSKSHHAVLEQNPFLIVEESVTEAGEGKPKKNHLLIAKFARELETHEEDESHKADNRNTFQDCWQNVALEEIKRAHDEIDDNALDKWRKLEPSHFDLHKEKEELEMTDKENRDND